VRFSIVLAATLAIVSVRAPAEHVRVTAGELQARRATLAKAIGSDAVFIAFSSEPARRTGDVDWPFRQEDNLLYLTGMNEPETTLVLLPGERERREVIFSRDRDPSNERWTGVIPSKEQVIANTGVRERASPRRFNSFIDALFQGRSWSEPGQSSYFAPPAMPAFLAAVRAGRAEVWLVMHARGAPGSALTREQPTDRPGANRRASRAEGEHAPGGAIDETTDRAIRPFEGAQTRERAVGLLSQRVLCEDDEGEIRGTRQLGLVLGEVAGGGAARRRSGRANAEDGPGGQLRIGGVPGLREAAVVGLS